MLQKVKMLPAFFIGDGKIAIKESQISFIEMMDKMYGEFEEQINHYNAIGFNMGNASGIKRKYEQHREYLVKRLSSQGNVCCTKESEMTKQTEGVKTLNISLF